MRFAQPEILMFLWLVPVLGVFLFGATLRQRRRARDFASIDMLDRLVPDLSHGRRLLRELLRLGAITCLILALARPQFGQRVSVLTREGIDLMVAIDTSASMLAQDTGPDENRLEAARRIATGLFDRLRGDRVGIVVFAGQAFVQCPLTIDDKAARMMLSAIGPEIVPQPGTAIRQAIERATEALTEEGPSKVIVLFTDGEDHVGDPVDAARRAAEVGVRIFTIGIGGEAGELIPVFNQNGDRVGYKRDRGGELVVSRLDERTLAEVAEVTGGRYMRSRGGAELDELFGEIDAMEKREVRGGFHAHYQDRFHIFAVAAFVLLALSRWLGERAPADRRGLRGVIAAGALVAVSGLGGWVSTSGAATLAAELDRGNEAYRDGDLEQAVQHYLDALEKDPASPEVHYNLGNALHTGGDYEQALAAYVHAASRADSNLAQAISYNLGNTLFRQGDYGKAAEAYKQALRLRPDDVDAKWNLEVALERLQEQEQQQDQQQQDQQQDQQQQDQQQDQQQEEQQQQQQQEEQQQQEQQEEQQQQSQEQQDEEPQSPQDQEQQQQEQQQQEQQQDSGEQEPTDQSEAQPGEPSEEEMSSDDARRLLEALGTDEQELLRERFRARSRRTDVEKDW